MEPKLSRTQSEVLGAIRAAGKAEYSHYMGRFGGDHWSVKGVGRCTAQVKALVKKGYLAVRKVNIYGDAVATIAASSSLPQAEQEGG